MKGNKRYHNKQYVDRKLGLQYFCLAINTFVLLQYKLRFLSIALTLIRYCKFFTDVSFAVSEMYSTKCGKKGHNQHTSTINLGTLYTSEYN